ncbi:hypothetical protein ACTNEW_06950 [Blautia sp. HCP3S3_G3]|uniref:hypothetical protein n=1 Tax=Blautia sp. HCP3S3_G3 TaxID=3438913 RepID=UPI003F8A5AB5
MSKFLKFIVHFIVICTILCVVALAVPPFLGVTTEIMDDSGKDTNLTYGSVTYAIPVKTDEIPVGTPILVQGDTGVYRYNIVSLDLENHTGTVIDPNADSTETVNVAVKNYVPKVAITIPFLGYLLIATESIEGLIILGLAVLFLIILYVIAELWKKDSEEDYDDDDDEETYVKSAKELKREEKERERRLREEDREMLRSEKSRKKEEKKKRRIIKTGGFVDEVYEDELDDEEEEQPRKRANVQTATSEAHELLKKEIAAATADETEVPIAKQARKAAPAGNRQRKSARPKNQPVREKEEPVEIKKMAIPIRSAAQLADMAKKQGDAPDIVRDEITKVTLFDYSDIIGADEDYEEE